MIPLFIFVVSVVMVQADYKPLTLEQQYAVGNYTEDTPQNLWELSGQYEGDMVYTKQQLAEKLSKNGMSNTYYRWLKNKIIVEVDPSFSPDQRNRIVSALNTLVAGTCLSWGYRTARDVDYVHVTKEQTGCWSHVGRIRGKQLLNLQDPGCWASGPIIHEFLHAFGFDHMHSDPNRDAWVWIYWNNIIAVYQYAFQKDTSLTSFGYSYDYDSVMHYSPYAFAINSSSPTILRNREPYYTLGNNVGPTWTDTMKLRAMYGCK